ncbi:hypothetical protein A2774_01885 [Candidatus Roizmanbacteria bacterium RIFCSPHIGHO2_01_FULL_39_12c]|uniref:Uncharacterized protein n=1 Tax=Candidatus Roizmanbacteria bacterium RIFCSPHIGHO2_01_FULL_39_12c TaxID=1802031 RepID=A0A1F7G9M7_9BACT|nr:MAG: hypothetical protein A2774_01885 [Candidatus Roizmanbacteria bacterium RIFCSPHIGHO2_01_FULL_39_12c]
MSDIKLDRPPAKENPIEYNYPYVEGVVGINMSEILTPGFQGKIKSGSGRELSADVTEKGIIISDVLNNYYHLQALFNSNDSSLSFGIYTKVKAKDKKDILSIKGRHPDLFAKHFITIALEYFSNIGVQIEQCKGNWSPGENNYRKFMQSLKSGLDPVESAKRTWAGRQFISNGFGRIAQDNIFPLEITNKPASITASFYRG